MGIKTNLTLLWLATLPLMLYLDPKAGLVGFLYGLWFALLIFGGTFILAKYGKVSVIVYLIALLAIGLLVFLSTEFAQSTRSLVCYAIQFAFPICFAGIASWQLVQRLESPKEQWPKKP